MHNTLPAIYLGLFQDYELFILRGFSHPPLLVARCAEEIRSRKFSPKLLGLSMVATNAAIGEAYRRAVAQGHGDLVAAAA